MKKILFVLLLCSLVFSSTYAFAENYFDIKAFTPNLFVNNEKIETNQDILVVNGVTYIAMSDMSKIFKFRIGFNPEDNTVRVLPNNVLEYVNGSKYIGDVSDEKPNGFGKSYGSDGKLIYQGQWINGVKNGIGQLYYTNGNVMYSGFLKENTLDGLGVFYYNSGEKYYEGEFKNDLFNGYGKQYNLDGKIVKEGYWKNGELN